MQKQNTFETFIMTKRNKMENHFFFFYWENRRKLTILLKNLKSTDQDHKITID